MGYEKVFRQVLKTFPKTTLFIQKLALLLITFNRKINPKNWGLSLND